MSDDQGFDYSTIEVGHYDKVFRRERGIQSKWHHLKFARIRTELANGGDHLDIGCGPGTFIGTLGDQVSSTGVDIAPGQISYARTHFDAPNKRFLAIDDGPLPFDDACFDCVTIVEIIEHLTPGQTLALLTEAHRVLRPGGRILASTPNYRSLWPVLEWLVNRLGEVPLDDQHINPFHRGRLGTVLREAGFNDVEVAAYQGVASFAAALGWRFADFVDRLEPRFVTNIYGFLLLGSGRKPS